MILVTSKTASNSNIIRKIVYNDINKICMIMLINQESSFPFGENKMYLSAKYSFDKNNWLRDVIKYDSSGSILSKASYKYDKLVEEIEYSKNGVLLTRKICKYTDDYSLFLKAIDYEYSNEEIEKKTTTRFRYEFYDEG